MNIAFTFNLRTDDSEDQAEFDSPATIAFIKSALESFGHTVTEVELTRPLIEVIGDLERLRPDLVFNMAEGKKGRLREAFWPMIFEELGLPYTGADPHTLALSLDKAAAKAAVDQTGVKMPSGRLVTASAEADRCGDLRFPVIVKPNFEGSSKGIRQKSVVEEKQALASALEEALCAYPDGVLVEEYIQGHDVTVPFLEVEEGDPVMGPVLYHIDPEASAGRRYNIYDYELKNDLSHLVTVKPADFAPEVLARVKDACRRVLRAIPSRDFGRMDFRVTPEGDVYFLEINCLASLEKGASLFLGAAARGLGEKDVIHAIAKSAIRRQTR